MCGKHKKRELPPTDLGAWLSQAGEDREVANMDSMPSTIRCYHAQQAVEKLLKAAIIANVGEFQIECPEIVRQRKQHPPRADIVKWKIPPCAWVLPAGFDFPFTHDLCELWGILQKYDGAVFQPLSESDRVALENATKSAEYYRYPAYRVELGFVVGYSPEAEVFQIVKVMNRLYSQLKAYVLDVALADKKRVE